MGTPSVTNILKTGAVLWVAPVGEAKPDETTVVFDAAWGGNWVRVGFTKAPLAMAYKSDEADIDIEEHLAAVKRYRSGEELTLETVLAELTAEYLQLAASNQDTITTTAAGAGQKGYEETGLGDEPILTEKQWGFEGRYITAAGADQPVRVFIHKGTALLNGNLEFTQKGDSYVGIPLQIKALVDTAKSQGQRLALFQRVTAPAT